ncbi:MAG TPA: carbohydrate porin [Verrucomicrobiae bacterium]|nr:carbohydrate porin [Verrucomicrobiae bacterium]
MRAPKKTTIRLNRPALCSFLACAATNLIAADPAGPEMESPQAPSQPQALAASTNQPASETSEQNWNWHAQNTDIFQFHPSFPAKYSGPNSLHSHPEANETVSLDLLVGRRLWEGAEAHVDGLMWQGFGFSKTLGIEGFPNAEAFRLGTDVPNVNFTRAFLRQTIGLGGEQETVEDDDLNLAGKRDISRLTLTVGRFSAKDMFDGNSYANDPRAQFMNWAFAANEAWDYPADSIGFTTGLAMELNQPQWSLRYGFFQVPRNSNGTAQDQAYTRAWAMATEFEHRHTINGHPGAIRLLAYLNHAHMGSYAAVADNPAFNGDITLTRDYRSKFGVCLNAEQELTKGVGAFLRAGWSDGRNEAWMYSDVDHTASLGLSIQGAFWNRTNDTLGIAGAINSASRVHQQFLAVGGTGILAGDGALSYNFEELTEAYYDIQIWKTIHASVDYQFVSHPAFNRDRGPVHVFGLRLHWTL